MPVYPCPECGAQLRPANPVPAGKKLRCPKCETVFAPGGAAKAAARAPVKASPPAVAADSSEEGGSYGLAQVEPSQNEEAARRAFEPIKNRFALSARGPALILVVKPSTWLLRLGVFTCIMAIVGVMFAIWPLIFKVEIVDKPAKGVRYGPQNQERRFKELTPEDYQERWLMLAGSIFQFAWGAVICAGASKMHELKAYPLSMTASIMSLVGPFVPLGIVVMQFALANDETVLVMPGVLSLGGSIPFSIWCIATLRNKKVLAGFAEEEPEAF
jgi:hypothetical protein